MFKNVETLMPNKGRWSIFNEHGDRKSDFGVYVLERDQHDSNLSSTNGKSSQFYPGGRHFHRLQED